MTLTAHALSTSLAFASTFFTSMLLTGCASPDATAARGAIVNGTSAIADSAVGLVSVQLADGGFVNCTVEVIAPHVLLTAAHCVAPQVVGKIVSLSVFVGPDAHDETALADFANWPRVVDVQRNPRYDPRARAHDNAVLLLGDPVTIPPLPIYRGAITSAMIGQPLRLIGYGATDPTDIETWGVRTQTTVTMSGFADDTIWYDDTVHSGCGGDSGGAGLMTFWGQEVLVATILGSRDPRGACDAGGVLGPVALDFDAFLLPFIAAYDPGYTPEIVEPLAPDLGEARSPSQADSPAGCSTHGTPFWSALFAITFWWISRPRRRADTCSRSSTAGTSSLRRTQSGSRPPA